MRIALLSITNTIRTLASATGYLELIFVTIETQ